MTKEEFIEKHKQYKAAVKRAEEQYEDVKNACKAFEQEYLNSFIFKVGDLIRIDRIPGRELCIYECVERGYITSISLSNYHPGGIDLMVVKPNKTGSRPAERYCGSPYWNVLPEEITILKAND